MSLQQEKIKAVLFDFMGTCLDWHSSVVKASQSSIPGTEASKLALEWRRQYFLEIAKRFREGLAPEDIDDTLARTLQVTLEQAPRQKFNLHTDIKRQMIEAWHNQPAWPEVEKAIQSVRKDLGLEVFVYANGTTRLQLDLTRSSRLSFDMLFSSQLLGVYKPSPEAYNKALQLVKLNPEEVVMVAAHAYDLRAAQKLGMRTIYIHRWTDDIDEDMEKVKLEFDVFLESMEDLPVVIASL